MKLKTVIINKYLTMSLIIAKSLSYLKKQSQKVKKLKLKNYALQF